MLLQFGGRMAHIKKVRKEDFQAIGIDHDDVVFDLTDREAQGRAEVSDEAAQYLLDNDDFTEVSETAQAPAVVEVPTEDVGGSEETAKAIGTDTVPASVGDVPEPTTATEPVAPATATTKKAAKRS